ncbi:hypothetical protein BT96DRAFT_930228, partial [Gymnopus androsaceus JB14]
MSLCSSCNGPLFSSRIQDSPLILEKLHWESGPASIPNPEEVIPTLQKAQRELEDCEKQIKALEAWRESLRGYTDQLQALRSPFRKVPDEILQRVFDDCCNMNHFVVDNPSRTPGAIRQIPALALSTVCSRWRRNGLAMPSIWSNISLLCREDVDSDDEEYEEVDSDGILYTMDIFLNRGLQHPMTVILELIEGFDDQHPVLTLLIHHIHRWRSFTDRTQNYAKNSLLHCHTSPNFPVLEELFIADASEGDLDIFSSTPKLKKLSLDIIPSGSLELSIFSQLSHLEFHYPSVDEIQELSGNSHLVTLKTDESYEGSRSDFELEMSPPTTCRAIDTLILCYDLRNSSRSIFSCLTLPSLKVIHLERGYRERRNEKIEPYMRESDWCNFDPFMVFLSRSSCTLTTLYIKSCALADVKLVKLLAHLPTLRDFSIDDSYVVPQCSPITGRFIQSLQAREDTSPIVPRLHSLKLNVGARSFDDGSVVDMVRSRWIPCKLLACASRELEPRVDCLREVTIRFRNREETK